MDLFGRLWRRKSTASEPIDSPPPHVPFAGAAVGTDLPPHAPDLATRSSGEERSHYLVVVDGFAPGQSVELGAEAFTIGRMPPSDLVLPDPRVSRSHCQIRVVGDEVEVADLDSKNGTFVDGERVSGATSLRLGGTLQVGEHVLEHRLWTKRELEAWLALTIRASGRTASAYLPRAASAAALLRSCRGS